MMKSKICYVSFTCRYYTVYDMDFCLNRVKVISENLV